MPTFDRMCRHAPGPQQRRGRYPRRRFLGLDDFDPDGAEHDTAAINFAVTGNVVDASNVAAPGARVDLYRTGDNSLAGSTTTDGSGNFSIVLSNNAGTFYARAYLPGAPDTFGTTVNTLIATQV